MVSILGCYGDGSGEGGCLIAGEISYGTVKPVWQFPGQRADGADAGPVVAHFAPGAIRRLDSYAAHRDRFDEQVPPVVSGTRAGGSHFCTGCHTGHTAANPVPERLK